MDRLISSSPLLRRAPAASKPRAPRPPPSFLDTTPPCRSVGRPPLASLLARHRPAPPPVPASSSGAPSSAAAAAEGEDDVASAARRRFFQKVTSAAAVTLLSAIVLTLIQPALPLPSALAHFHPAAAKAGTTTLFKSELLGSAWTGFLAGCLHTLSGPDHLAALAPLSIGRSRVESAAVGALWGCGHDAGQVIFGLLFLGLKDRLHIEIIRTWSTRVVALTLLIIGGLGIREASEAAAPALENGGAVDGRGGHHHHQALPAGGGGMKKKEISFATFATGIVHGLQPDALMMVLPALALPSRVAGAAFLGMFLVGTVVSMGSYTVLIGSCSEALKERVPQITEKLTWAASLVAISMGLAILVSQSFGVTLY